MKKVKLCSLIMLLVVCLSGVVYADEPWDSLNFNRLGFAGYIEITKVEDPGQTTLVDTKYSLLLGSVQTMVNGLPFRLDTENWKFLIDGDYIQAEPTVYIKDENDTVLAVVPGDLSGPTEEWLESFDDPAERENKKIGLIYLGSIPIDYTKLKMEIVYDGGRYEMSLGLTEANVVRSEIVEGEPGFLATIWNWITDPVDEVTKLLEEVLVELLLPLGDGVVHTVSKSVGEVVTIDRLIFNRVDKVNIDYWDASGDALTGTNPSVRGIMSKVVVPWYTVFYKIAILVYMMVLVAMGIVIMFSSTAEKKAKYNQIFTSWVLGVAILTLFPYVMKYVVKLNDAVVTQMYVYLYGHEPNDSKYVPDILNWEGSRLYDALGKDEFVFKMINLTVSGNEVSTEEIQAKGDEMMLTRFWAQKRDNIVLTAVYFIFIGQMLVLLFMYYKRAFMLAFLITIFPLVAMTFVLDKIGDKKAQSFGIWFKEYLLNVVVQIFHAVVYALIVGTGVRFYLEHGGTNWLFLVYSVLFLFQGEKILRGIFGMKSAANTIGDLASSGLAAYGALKSLPGLAGDKGNIAGKQDQEDMEGASNRQQQRAGTTGPSPVANGAAPSGGGTPPSGSTPQSNGNYTGNDPAGVNTRPFDMGAAKDTVMQRSMKRRMKRGALSGATHMAGKLAGAAVGATYGLSKGDTGNGLLGNAVSGAIAGESVGELIAKPAEFAANKAEQKWHGHREANRIASGANDKALGLDQITPADVGMNDVDPNEIIGKHGETFQEIVRKALAEQARVTASKGAAKGELAFMQYMENNTTRRGS